MVELNSVDAFEELWKTRFPDCPPVTHEFKWKLNDLWLRIHNLPGSKRYPENPEESNEILRRQHSVLGEMFGENDDCFLILAVPATGDVVTGKWESSLATRMDEDSIPISLQFFDTVTEDETYRVFFERGSLQIDSLDRILIQVANDEERGFFILSAKTFRIFAPYDGGVDLIFENPAIRNIYREKYSDWLSTHESGL